jgi:hypothetical protein
MERSWGRLPVGSWARGADNGIRIVCAEGCHNKAEANRNIA